VYLENNNLNTLIICWWNFIFSNIMDYCRWILH